MRIIKVNLKRNSLSRQFRDEIIYIKKLLTKGGVRLSDRFDLRKGKKYAYLHIENSSKRNELWN